MKYNLPVLFAAYLFFSCNSGKEKTATTNIPTDTVIADKTALPDPTNETTIAIDTPVTANRLIVPGKSIGLTSIGQKNKEALSHLGEPSSEDAGMGKELATWYSKPVVRNGDTIINEMNIFFRTNMGGADEASRVSYIRITSSFFMTVEHISNGSNSDSIQKHFPGIKKIASGTSPKTKKQITIYDDSRSGIAFEVDPQQICVGITVHKPGEKAYEIYNVLFEDIKFL